MRIDIANSRWLSTGDLSKVVSLCRRSGRLENISSTRQIVLSQSVSAAFNTFCTLTSLSGQTRAQTKCDWNIYFWLGLGPYLRGVDGLNRAHKRGIDEKVTDKD